VIDPWSLAVGGIGGVAASRALVHLREHRAEPRGLADLLNWGFMVDDGVVLQKDGSLLAGWRYRGPDLGAATEHEMNALARHLNDALLPFGDDWMFHVDAIRRPAVAYAASSFPDPITQLVDDERRAVYEAHASRHFETEYFLVVTHLPPTDALTHASAFFIQRSNTSPVDWAKVLDVFSVTLHTIENRLSGYLTVERLSCNGLLGHLHECLSGLNHPVRAPDHGSYLNVVLADQELLGGFEPSIGRMSIRAVAIHGYPHESHPGHLDFLNTLPFGFRWSNRIIPLSNLEAAKQIRRHQLQWFKKRKGAGAWVQEMASSSKTSAPKSDDELWLDHDARDMARDAGEAASENASGLLRFCFYTQVVIVMDKNPERANHVASEILKSLNDAGFTGRIETVNTLDSYLGSLPGHGYPNLRRPLVSTRNIADLLPITSVWPGLAHNPSSFFPPQSPPLMWAATAGTTPFRVNLHDSDVGHTLLLGRTGSGKSILLGMLAAQFRRYPRAQIFVFDVGYSMWTLAKAAGATHYDLAAGRPDALKFQPLAAIDDPSERAWAAEWVETVLTLQGVQMTAVLRARVERALELVAGNARVHRTLTEFTVQLQDEALSAALKPYTVGGNYGQLLDATSDDLQDARFQVFEMKHLLALDERIALPVLLYLFRRIEQRLDGSPTLIEIDEAWMALMHSLFGARVNQWLLTLRKQNAAVVLATQSPSQLAQLTNRHTVVDSCATRVYLPNAEASTPGQAPLYRDLGLNDREIALIAEATAKRHYYMKSSRGSRLFELGLGPVALSFLSAPVGSSMEETRRHVDGLIATHGASWPAALLDERGLGSWAGRFREYLNANREPSNETQLAFATAQ
jgi:type IV secretion/conjugal transfer VirB4 family ATPase